MRRGNFGSMLIDAQLPEQMRGKARTLDAKGLAALFKELHETSPDSYPTVLKNLADVGRRVSTETGGFSFGPEDLIEPDHITKLKDVIRQKVHHEVLRNRPDSATAILREFAGTLPKDLYAHQLSIGSPMAKQIASGSRGNPGAMARLMSGDVMYVDHRDREVPYPILRGFAEGLDPAEYFGASFGGRKGVVDTKLSVQNSGALAKVLKQAVHKFVVTKQEDDFEDHPDRPRGLPVDTEDAESDGAFLAHGVAGFPRNTVLSSKVRAAIKAKGVDRILVRSPISGRIAPGGGLYAKDVGIRESGALPGIGDAVGVTASDTISEPVGQGTLSSKHAGGAAGSVRKVGGFKALQQTISVPKTFPGGAAHADTDGNVDSITDHPDGGKVVSISGTEHYVAPGFKINVKPGDTVEAGDPISDGLPNPSRIADHQGLGEAKRKMVGYLKGTLDDLNIASERRNLELVAHGLVNHVMVDDELGPYYPGDVIPYDEVEKHWEPRHDSRLADVDDAAGQYLEHPVLHYSVGTKIRPSVRKELKSFGIKNIQVHPEAPPFHAHMVRAQDSLRHDPDWMTRFLGTNLEDSLLDATHRGMSSSPSSVSFVPAVASGQIENFGPIAGKGILKSKPGSVLSGIGMFGKAANVVEKPKALIVKGNPAFLNGAGTFYDDLASHVSSLGYDTSIHGDEEDLPPAAAVLGHSRGARKVDNLPTGTIGIPLASWRKGSINHPDDTALMVGGKVTPAHFTLTDDMKSKITQALSAHLSKAASEEDHGHGQHYCSACGTMVWQCRCITRPGQTRKQYHDVDPSQCRNCTQEKKAGGFTAAAGTGSTVTGGPMSVSTASGGPMEAPRHKILPVVPKPPPQPKAISGITEGNSLNKPVPGVQSNPLIKNHMGEGMEATPEQNVLNHGVGTKPIPLQNPTPAPMRNMFPTGEGMEPIPEQNMLNHGIGTKPVSETIAPHGVSPLTSAAVSALGQPVAQYGGLAGLAALTDFTGHNGSNIQTLLGDRQSNPNAYLYERSLPAGVNPNPEPTPPPPPPPAPATPAPAAPAPAAPAPAAPAPAAPAPPPPAPVAGISGRVGGSIAGNLPAVTNAAGNLAAKNAPKIIPKGVAKGLGGAGAMTALPVIGDTVQQLAETGTIDPKRLGGVAGEATVDAGAYAGTNAALNRAVPGGPGFVPTQVVTSTVKDLADSAGVLPEWAGGSKDDATRIQNAQNVQEAVGDNMFGKAFRGEAYTPWDLTKAWGSAALNSLSPKFITNTQAAIKAHNEYEQGNKDRINTNMQTGPAIGASARSGIAKAQAAGDPQLEMRNRLAAAESDARLSHSNMMSSAPLWSTGGPKGHMWNHLGDQMADLARARVMHEHGMKEDGTPMATDERYRLGEAIKQRSAMIQRNQDTLNKGFWSDAFSG